MSAGASTAAPKVSAPALVVIPKSPTVALPPSSLTTTFWMTSWICPVFVNVQETLSPASIGTETLVSPASKSASAPMSTPPVSPVQTMFVSVQPAGTASVTVLVPNWVGTNAMGLPA